MRQKYRSLFKKNAVFYGFKEKMNSAWYLLKTKWLMKGYRVKAGNFGKIEEHPNKHFDSSYFIRALVK